MSTNIQESATRDGPSAPAKVDLFLSYNSKDIAAVRNVQKLLSLQGVTVFYDQESLHVGQGAVEQLERALEQARGVLVFLGPNGLGPWQKQEKDYAIQRKTREPTFPVIPVFLPNSNVDEYGGFLLSNIYVDLRSRLDDPDTLDRIIREVRVPVPGTEASPEAAGTCPYLGLRAFGEEDAPLFFGRNRLVDDPKDPKQGLLYKVRTCPLVAVVGASGSGKSSVVYAGLIPRLRREPRSEGTWNVVAFRPGKDPFFNLAIVLEKVRNPEARDTDCEEEAAKWRKLWSSGDVALLTSLEGACEALGVDRLLVVVDQFEELVTQTPKDNRQPFLSRLLAPTAAESKITVLLTLRADYYWAIDLIPGLSDSVQRGLINVGAMTRDDLREAIEGPARRVGLKFESAYLVDRLLNDVEDEPREGVGDKPRDDVGDKPGNLPLLEFALTKLWQERKGKLLTHDAYQGMGGVAGALPKHADEVFEKLTPGQKAAAPRLFRRLVRVPQADEAGADTRLRVRLGDLDDASRSAVDPFVKGRLLVTTRAQDTSIAEANPERGPTPVAIDGPTTVEIVHETLIRKWKLLQEWLTKDREFLLWRQRLGFQIAEWERSGTLLSGALLREARRIARSRHDDLNDRERKFLKRSKWQSRLRLLRIAVITFLTIGSAIAFSHYQKALTLFKEIQESPTEYVPNRVRELTPYQGWVGRWLNYRVWVDWRLKQSLQETEEPYKGYLKSILALLGLVPVDPSRVEYLYKCLLTADNPDSSQKYLNSSLALLPVDPSQAGFLFRRLLAASPTEALVIGGFLGHHQADLTRKLWPVLESAKAGDVSVLNTASPLAEYDAASQQWESQRGKVAQGLVSANSVYLSSWLTALRPVRAKLNAPLAEIFRDSKRSDSERDQAADILTVYAKDDPKLLADLLMDAEPKAYAAFFLILIAQRHEAKTVPLFEAEINKKLTLPDSDKDAEAVKDRLAQRQARAAIALVRMGKAEKIWPLLKHSADPRLRSFIVNGFCLLEADPTILTAQLDRLPTTAKPTPVRGQQWMETVLFHYETSIRRALILAIGKYGTEGLSQDERGVLIDKLLKLYKDHPDAGIHGAAEWSLRRWGQQDEMKKVDAELMKLKDRGDRRWYVNSQGQTFALVEGPVDFLMGSPPNEPDRDDEEVLHPKSIDYRFAVASKEVTVEEYQEFVKANPKVDHANNDKYSPDPKGPMNVVYWYHAAAYCNWLSRKEDLPECYEPNDKGKFEEGMQIKADALKLTGYRLPTEAEWEYACRAGTGTSRYYGASVNMLKHYAWFQTTSPDGARPCGSLLPNDLGLFDMLGNVWEWCQDQFLAYEPGNSILRDDPKTLPVIEKDSRILRGGSFIRLPGVVRSATRYWIHPSFPNSGNGFRLCRTYP